MHLRKHRVPFSVCLHENFLIVALRWLLLVVGLLMHVGSAGAEMYEDAENQDIDGWRVVDNMPAGASISNAGEGGGNRFIRLRGKAQDNGFMLGGYEEDAGGWNNQEDYFVSWKFRTQAGFRVLFRVDTTDGWRYLYYDQRSNSVLAESNGRFIHHGLGSQWQDGTWQLLQRDLRKDLASAQPDNQLLSVQGIVVRGSLDIDDIQLLSQPVKPAMRTDVQAPTASLVARTGEDGRAPTVYLDATGSVDNVGISSYHWLFGDGTSLRGESARQVKHEYEQAGGYTVTLNVSDAAGNQSAESVEIDVGVVDAAPVAVFTTRQGSTAALTVDVDASYSSDDIGIADYLWSFVDDNTKIVTATGVTANHTFATAGLKTIELVVTDSNGASSYAMEILTVENP